MTAGVRWQKEYQVTGSLINKIYGTQNNTPKCQMHTQLIRSIRLIENTLGDLESKDRNSSQVNVIVLQYGAV